MGAIISQEIFCAHGGISKDLNEMCSINQLCKPALVPDGGLMCDLLWSDPDEHITKFIDSDRAVSCLFGYDEICKFVSKFDFDLIVRAHQVEHNGFRFHCGQKLLTIFSAP